MNDNKSNILTFKIENDTNILQNMKKRKESQVHERQLNINSPIYNIIGEIAFDSCDYSGAHTDCLIKVNAWHFYRFIFKYYIYPK